VGQKIVFSKDIAEDSTSVWIASDGTEVTNGYLLTEPASPRVFQVRLVETKAEGVSVAHVAEVEVYE